MKKSLLILFLLLFAADAFSQKSGWDKLQTDDGEMTMLMPADCSASFYDRYGITVYDRDYRDKFRLTEMRLISCYRDGALLNVEIYESIRAKSAAQVLRKKLGISGEELNVGKDFFAVGQIEEKDDHTLARRIVAGDRRLYLITTAARRMPNETMQIFLDSVRFASENTARKPDADAVLISSLENLVPEVVMEREASEKPSAAETSEDQTLKEMILLSIPQPSYTDAARKKRTTGRSALRLTFGAEGRITRLQIVLGLPDGLVRETVIAALRIKFLPPERGGAPISVTRQIQYNFGIN